MGAGATGSGCHFWDLAERRVEQTIDLGARGLIPLEVRWLHDPDAAGGFVGFPRAVRAVPRNMLLEGAAPSR